MKCRTGKRLPLYYYGELDEAEKRRIESHLQNCERCSAAWGRLKNKLDGLRCDPPEIPEGYWQEYRRSVRRKIGNSFRRSFLFSRPLLQGVMAVMVLLAVATAGFHYYRGRQDRIMLFQNYELISKLDLLEDFDLLRSLKEVENL
ncbi:MAG: hypothetical protein GXP58_01710 [Deltaproteobacteria bacterium]|nr:hypothetical protein [Deltaproteobacteria bacterium]